MPFEVYNRILWNNFAWKRIWIIGLILDRRWYIWVERQIKLLASPQLLYNKMKDSAGLKTTLLIQKWNSKQHFEGGLFFIYKYWTSHLKTDFVLKWVFHHQQNLTYINEYFNCLGIIIQRMSFYFFAVQWQ